MQPSLTFNAWLRYDLIRQYTRRVEPCSSFLEIGCGGGAMGARLADYFEYVAYEPDEESFELAQQRIGEKGKVINDFLPEEPLRTFDVVAAFEVLEHLPDDEAVLAAWRRWLRPGGSLLLSVPAKPSRFGPADEAVGHFRRYTREGLAKLLLQCGFLEPSVASTGFPLGYLLEFGRNRLAPRTAPETTEDRIASSGRLFQPSDRYWWLSLLATAPFRLMQRPFAGTDLGTGLVSMARRPG